MYRLSTDGRSDSTIDWDWVDMEPSWLVVVFGFTFRMICIRGWFGVSVWVRLLASMLVWLHTYTYCYFIAGIFRYSNSMPRGIWLFVPSLLSPVTTCMYDWLSVCLCGGSKEAKFGWRLKRNARGMLEWNFNARVLHSHIACRHDRKVFVYAELCAKYLFNAALCANTLRRHTLCPSTVIVLWDAFTVTLAAAATSTSSRPAAAPCMFASIVST